MTERPERCDPLRTHATSFQEASRSRSLTTLLILACCAAFIFACLVALGTWQLYRLQWKVALIERVEQRVQAPPLPAPGPDRWPTISAETDEYKHVSVSGTFLFDQNTKVQAATELGAGYWLLTPLRDAAGNLFLVNRGFIPPNVDAVALRNDSGVVTIDGLLRITEPGGGFLRHNDPANNRWYSRDVQAIAAMHGLQQFAPYFIDADASFASGRAKYPVGGLTVVHFRNSHLTYALTWYALALMVAGAAIWVGRTEWNSRRKHPDSRS